MIVLSKDYEVLIPARATWKCALFIFLLMVTAVAGAQGAGPIIRYANILGGSRTESVAAVAVDQDGALYVTGLTDSTDFPSTAQLAPSHIPDKKDIFVAKVDPSGAQVVYSVTVGTGTPVAIAVDSAGSAYVAGRDAGTDFPLTEGAISPTGRCFLFKLDPAGSKLVYATNLPCQSWANIYEKSLAVDTEGNAYLTGYTTELTTTPGAFNTTGFGPFVMKVNSQGTALVYSTFLPGTPQLATARPEAIAVDGQGNAYVTGSASARGFPASVNLLSGSENDTAEHVFVVKVSADGSEVPYSTLLDGSAQYGSAIVPGADGSVFVAGEAGMVAKLNASGSALVFRTSLPGALDAYCLAVGDSGIDVLTSEQDRSVTPDFYASRLTRLSRDGSSVLSSSLVSTIIDSSCGQNGSAFALAAAKDSYAYDMAASADLTAIGPAGGESDVWFSTVSADEPEAPTLQFDAQELYLVGGPAADGGFPPLTRTLHATTGGATLPLGVFGYRTVSISPALTVTPAAIDVTLPQGSYPDRFIVFAPGAQNGLLRVDVKMRSYGAEFTVQPLTQDRVVLFATGPDAPPVSTTLHIGGSTYGDIFLTPIPAQVNYTATTNVSWLTVEPKSGTTPADLRITANPAGLASNKSRFGVIKLQGPPKLWGSTIESPSVSIPVTFTIGTPAAGAPHLTVDPYEFSLRLEAGQASSTAQVHVDSTGDPISFTVGALPDWLTVSPTSGTTPTDLTVTASDPGVHDTWVRQGVQLLYASDGAVANTFYVQVAAMSSDHVDELTLLPMSTLVTTNALYAPGALFRIRLGSLAWYPTTPGNASPTALAASLAGFSFKIAGIPAPLQSYESASFLAQIPWDAPLGEVTLDGYDDSGLARCVDGDDPERSSAEVSAISAISTIHGRRLESR